jgi:hypothetical protein
MRKAFNLKKIHYFSILLSVLAFSCATSGEDKEENTVTIKDSPNIRLVRNSGQFREFVAVDGSSFNSGLAYYKGLDRITALRYNMFLNKNLSWNKMAVMGRHSQNTYIPTNVAFYCSNNNEATCSPSYNYIANPTKPTSGTSFGLMAGEFDALNTTSASLMSFAFGGNTQFYATEDLVQGRYFFSFTSTMRAIQTATDKSIKILVWDQSDALRLERTYVGNAFLESSSIIQSVIVDSNTFGSRGQAGNIFSKIKPFLDNGGTLVMPTGTMTKFSNANDGIVSSMNTSGDNQVAYGYYSYAGNTPVPTNAYLPVFTEGFLTGNIAQYMEGQKNNANKNNIALSVAVQGSGGGTNVDFTYKPYAAVVLPGSLRDYAFSVMIKPEFLTSFGTNGAGKETSGQIANSLLASHVNTLGSLFAENGGNTKAISTLKTNYTLKKYGNEANPAAFNNTNLNSGFVQFNKDTFETQVGSSFTGTALQKKIIAYFDEYITVNSGTTIKDEINSVTLSGAYNTSSDVNKWNSIKALYGGNLHYLSQFITTSDVIVCNGACNSDYSNIISMNGIHGKEGDFKREVKEYTYFDSTGVARIGQSVVFSYKKDDKWEVVASNVFGNGVVDFTSLDADLTFTNKVNGNQYGIYTTKANTSAILGDGFKKSGISKFLSQMEVNLGSVYVGEETSTVMSLNGNVNSVNGNSVATSFNSLFSSKLASTGGNFNLGVLNFSLQVSGNEASNSGLNTEKANKQRVAQGFVGGAKRFGDYFLTEENGMAFNGLTESKGQNNNVKNFSLVAPISENASLAFLASGNSVNGLSFETVGGDKFSILGKDLGFRKGYSSFQELFNESESIQGTSFKFGDESLKFNTIFAIGSRENYLNGKTESASFSKVEAEKSMDSLKVKLISGILVEEGSFLGTQFSGGFEINSTQTMFAGIEIEEKLFSSIFINGSFEYGVSKVNSKNSIINNFSDVKSSAFSVGLSDKNFFGGILGFTYSEGLRINSGSVTLFNGISSGTFNISPEGKERNIEVSLGKTYKASSLMLSLVHTEDLNNIKGEKQNLVVLKALKKF